MTIDLNTIIIVLTAIGLILTTVLNAGKIKKNIRDEERHRTTVDNKLDNITDVALKSLTADVTEIKSDFKLYQKDNSKVMNDFIKELAEQKSAITALKDNTEEKFRNVWGVINRQNPNKEG